MYKYIFSFLLYLLFISFYFISQYSDKTVMQYSIFKDLTTKSFNGAINSFELLNDAYHNQCENSMAKIIKDATGASKNVRDDIRYELRKNFTTLFNSRKLANLKSLHIFDKNGKSILRFHKLNKYDDYIINKRDSIKTLSTNFLAQKGLELGEYSFAYRFQYPLFYDGNFVGSYEFGIEFDAIDKEMQKLFGEKNILFFNNEEFLNKSYKETTNSKYKKVLFQNKLLYELETKNNSNLYNTFKEVINTQNINLETLNKPIKFKYEDKNYLVIFTSIEDINHKKAGYILTILQDKVSAITFKTMVEELTIAILLGLVAVFLTYKEIEYRKYIRNIIDTQHNILIVTDGLKIKDVNNAFYDFFHVKNIKDFMSHGTDCICDYFIEEEPYIQKVMDGKRWIDYTRESDDEHIAVIKNSEDEKRYFKIEINDFLKSNDFILIFYDVTDDLKERDELKNKAYYDSLTNIYSRERFDYHLKRMLEKKAEFSLIMFDIDHFKVINDKYGHDVGDSVLKELTTLVSQHIREDDIFARWGGEEFMIIVNIDIIKAERFANKLRQVIDEHEFKYINNLTCSFGVSGHRRVDKFETIVKRVDTMLYSAKDSGRNCVVVVS